jgi:hypothetical protein
MFARHLRLTLIAVAALGITACEDEADGTGPDIPDGPELNEVVAAGPLNASSTDTLVYFSFATNTLVSRTADWDIALRRYEVRLNGGVSGTKGVVGYSLDNNKTATDAQVIAFTVDNTLAAFDAIREAQIPADNLFVSDRLVENNVAYVSFAGAPSANGTAYWKVRTANGGYVLLRAAAIAYNQTGSLTSITLETRTQSGSALGTAQQIVVPITGAPVNISLVTGAAVTPNGCNWDIQVHPQTFAMTTNAACSVGTYPGDASPTFAAATTANDAPQYALFLAGLAGPIPNSVTDKSAPFRYNLENNNNRLYPSFNTYLIKTGSNVYKLQLINYYSAAGASGYPTIRYARIK